MTRKIKFLRRTSSRHSKLGRKRKAKQVWRKPIGRHNKMREKRRGYPAVVKIGYRKGEHKKLITIHNLKELEKAHRSVFPETLNAGAKEKGIIVVGKIGKKKKIEIAKKAKELKIKISNLNIDEFLEENKPKTAETKK
mgnify:CR=1 FL=1